MQRLIRFAASSAQLAPSQEWHLAVTMPMQSWQLETTPQSRFPLSRGSMVFSARMGLRARAQPDKDTCTWFSNEVLLTNHQPQPGRRSKRRPFFLWIGQKSTGVFTQGLLKSVRI